MADGCAEPCPVHICAEMSRAGLCSRDRRAHADASPMRMRIRAVIAASHSLALDDETDRSILEERLVEALS